MNKCLEDEKQFGDVSFTDKCTVQLMCHRRKSLRKNAPRQLKCHADNLCIAAWTSAYCRTATFEKYTACLRKKVSFPCHVPYEGIVTVQSLIKVLAVYLNSNIRQVFVHKCIKHNLHQILHLASLSFFLMTSPWVAEGCSNSSPCCTAGVPNMASTVIDTLFKYISSTWIGLCDITIISCIAIYLLISRYDIFCLLSR